MAVIREQRNRTPKRSLGVFSLLFGCWLFMFPQLALVAQDLSSSDGPVPVMVEEEVKHNGTAQPCVQLGPVGHPKVISAPLFNDELHRSHDGEVPHLPPWA